ncbi:MAG: viral A-type inclusion protein [Bacteroidetes bacterium]|nr:viral A-type inclusion protein [Bacteroidota bacterium]
MKCKIFSAAFLSLAVIACNNNDKKHEGHKKSVPQTREDSLMADVMDGHDEVMPKMGKVRGAQKEARRLIDSIEALPEKAKAEAAALKANLEELVKDLSYADFAMDKWMTEFNMDSAKDNMETRIQYLLDEKIKVGKVKDAILNSLSKADSLLKK